MKRACSLYTALFVVFAIALGCATENDTPKADNGNAGVASLTLKGHSDLVLSAAFSPDGKWIASGSRDQTVKVWDAETGQEMLTLTGHTDRVNSVAFNPDGKRIVSGSEDGTIKIWTLPPLTP